MRSKSCDDRLRQADPRRRLQGIPEPVIRLAHRRAGRGCAAHAQRIQPQIEMREGMIDRRPATRASSTFAQFAAAPLEGGRFIVELRRRPEPAPDAGRGPALEQHRERGILASLGNQQHGLARLAGAPALGPRQLGLASLARSDAERRSSDRPCRRAVCACKRSLPDP